MLHARSVFLFLFVLRITGFIIKGHQTQWANGALIVAGGTVDGETQASSETCILNEKGEFTCNNISPSLPKATLGVSFPVPSNYSVWFKRLHWGVVRGFQGRRLR